MTLDELIEAARQHTITPEEYDAQIISFVYGNLAIENPNITKEDIKQALLDLRASQ